MTANNTSGLDINWQVNSGQFTASPATVTSYSGYMPTYPEYHWWPYSWPYNYQTPDKFGQAFRIAQKLMEDKLVNVDNDVAKFVKLVNAIAENL